MKKFLLTFITIFVVACGSIKYSMHNDINNVYNTKQIDSICQVENIPTKFNTWDSIPMKDYEDNVKLVQYFYILSNDSIEHVYTVTKADTIYNFKKRTTKKIK